MTGALAIFLLTLGASSAAADTTTFTINQGNAALSGFSGPFATVTVDRSDSTHATITFTAAGSYFLGAQGMGGVNVNGSFSLASIAAGNLPDATDGGSSNEDGFGNFKQTIDNFDGAGHAVTSLQFSIVATGGNTWSSATSVLTNNSNGASVAAHIFAGCTGSAPNRTCTATGYASTGGAVNTPEPTSLTLFGGVLVFTAIKIRRRKTRVA
jgi:hypothetical protein